MVYVKIKATRELMKILPRGIVESLKLSEGKELELRVRARKKKSVRELRGLGKELWAGLDVEEYVRGERKAWEKGLEI